MGKQKIKKKYIFLGEEDSINVELIINSFSFLKIKFIIYYYVIKKILLRIIIIEKKI